MPRTEYLIVLKVFKYQKKKNCSEPEVMLYLNKKKLYDQFTFLIEDFHMCVYCFVKVIFSDIKKS